MQAAIFGVSRRAQLVFVPERPVRVLLIAVSIGRQLNYRLRNGRDFKIPLVLSVPREKRIFLRDVDSAISRLLDVVGHAVRVYHFLAAHVFSYTAADRVGLHRRVND